MKQWDFTKLIPLICFDAVFDSNLILEMDQDFLVFSWIYI